ncbi:hypothetical protein DICA1_B04588 [Diutina catenulata]
MSYQQGYQQGYGGPPQGGYYQQGPPQGGYYQQQQPVYVQQQPQSDGCGCCGTFCGCLAAIFCCEMLF